MVTHSALKFPVKSDGITCGAIARPVSANVSASKTSRNERSRKPSRTTERTTKAGKCPPSKLEKLSRKIKKGS